MSKEQIDEGQILRRLDAIIALLARSGDRKIGESMVILRDAGLRPIEISMVLGKSKSHVTKELAIARKNERKRGR
jgi:hypothetical protein